MDESMVFSSCSSSSLISHHHESPTSLQQKLQFLIYSQPQWWNYAIFWQATTNAVEGADSLSLSWAGGHFQGLKGPASEPMMARPKRRPDVDSNVEWFYMSSPVRFDPLKQGGAVTKAFSTQALVWLSGAHSLSSYGCDRAKEAQSHGLETLVCIPVSNGVLELGSLDLIDENWVLVTQAHSLFGLTGPLNLGWAGPRQLQPGPSELDSPKLSPENKKAAAKKRGKRPGQSPAMAASHVEAERQRREKMNNWFYALRSVVPTVSRMDRASLLSDAVAYINDLKGKIDSLESQLNIIKDIRNNNTTITNNNNNNHNNNNNNSSGNAPYNEVMYSVASDSQSSCGTMNNKNESNNNVNNIVFSKVQVDVEVKVMGSEAMIRAQSKHVDDPCARLMAALKDLRLQVHHASISAAQELMLQDVVIVNVPEELKNGDVIRAVILERLHC